MDQRPPGRHSIDIHIRAPGHGSPANAVELARSLKIHLWGAENSPAGWIACAEAIADQRRVPVTFFAARIDKSTVDRRES